MHIWYLIKNIVKLRKHGKILIIVYYCGKIHWFLQLYIRYPGGFKTEHVIISAAPAPAEESKSDTTPARPGKYVPPSLRGAMSASGSSDSPAATRQVPRKKKAAPNLHSEEDFPTLGGGPTAAELRYREKITSSVKKILVPYHGKLWNIVCLSTKLIATLSIKSWKNVLK